MLNKNSLIAFFSVLAEVAYLFLPYMLIAVLCKTVAGQLISFLYIFLMVIIITIANLVLASKPRRLITLIVLNLVLTWLFTLALLVIYGYNQQDSLLSLYLFQGNIWLTIQVWLVTILIGLIAGRALVICNRIINFREATNRLEISIAVFFITAILTSILAVPQAENMLVIILGLLSNSLAMALCQPSRNISFRYLAVGTLGLGVILAGAVTLLKLGQVFLANLSGWIYNHTVPYISGTFLTFMKWLLVKGRYIENDSPGSSSMPAGELGGNGLAISQSGTPQWLEYIFWLLMGLVILGLLFIVIILLINFVKYLLNPTSKVSASEILATDAKRGYFIWEKIKNVIFHLKLLYHIYSRPDFNLERLYQYFLLWGKQKDIPHLAYETPFEYCQRLGSKYPGLQPRLEFITESYVAYKYGKVQPDQETMRLINQSIKELYFPAH